MTTSSKKQGLLKVGWDITPLQEGEDREKYIDGFEYQGDISRKRIKEKEIGQLEFQATVKSDAWAQRVSVSQSNRTKLMNESLKIHPNFEDYSHNNKLVDRYKGSLIKTASVDRIPPFAYCESIRAAEMRDLQAMNKNRFYVKSADLKNLEVVKRPMTGNTDVTTKPPTAGMPFASQ